MILTGRQWWGGKIESIIKSASVMGKLGRNRDKLGSLETGGRQTTKILGQEDRQKDRSFDSQVVELRRPADSL